MVPACGPCIPRRDGGIGRREGNPGRAATLVRAENVGPTTLYISVAEPGGRLAAIAVKSRMVLCRTIHKLRALYWLLNRLTVAVTDKDDLIYVLSHVGPS